MKGGIMVITIMMIFIGSNVYAQEDIRNVSIILSVIPDNYAPEKGLVSTGYIGVSNNEGQGIFAPSDMEIELSSSNPEIIKVAPRTVIKENEPYSNFNLILSGEEGVTEISAIFQDQTITQTVSVGAVSGDVPVDVELVIMFPTDQANINSKIPFSVYVEPMRKRELPFAPTVQESARRIEFQNRRDIVPTDACGGTGGLGCEAPMQDPDVAIRITINADRLSPRPAVHVRRKLRPLLDEAIRCGGGLPRYSDDRHDEGDQRKSRSFDAQRPALHAHHPRSLSGSRGPSR